MHITDSMLDRIIDNEGTVDGLTVPNATGVLRLALDLRDAREDIRRLGIQVKQERALAALRREHP